MIPLIKHFSRRLKIAPPFSGYMDTQREREQQLAWERIRWVWHFGIGALVGALAFATVQLLTH